MKKALLGIMMGIALIVVGCAKYDDSALQDRVTKLEKAVKDLQGLNGQIDALRKLVEGSESGLTITNVTPIDGGFTITFSDNSKYTIISGKDGQDGVGTPGPAGPTGPSGDPGANGKTPEISVELVDGVYYWKVDGEFLKDASGNKVPASSVAPLFRINETAGRWEVSLDGGKTWKDCGPAVTTPDPVDVIFSNVEVGEEYVTFTLTDGTSFKLPLEKPFALVFAKTTVGIEPGKSVELAYTVEGADEATVVDAIATGAYVVEVKATDYKSGAVKVTAPDPVVAGRALVWADNGKGKTSLKAISFEAGEMSAVVVAGDAAAVAPEGDKIEVAVTSNMVYEVKIEETAKTWIHLVETKAAETKTLVFELDANTTGAARSGKVEIVGTDGTVYQTITFVQEPTDAVTLNGTEKFSDIQAAIDAAAALTSGEAVITMLPGNYEENLVIDGTKITVPITIDGEDAAKVSLTGSIEIARKDAVIKNITVNVPENAPKFEKKVEPEIDNYKNTWPTGIHIDYSGYGAVIETVTINADAVNTSAIFVAYAAEGQNVKDVVRNVTFPKANRGIQAYQAKILVENSTFVNAWTANAIRLSGAGCDAVFTGNTFEGMPCAIQFHNLTNSTVVLGDGEQDDNVLNNTKYTANKDVTAADAGNTFKPAVQYLEDGTVIIYVPSYPLLVLKGDAAAIAPTTDNRVMALDDEYVYLPLQNKGKIIRFPIGFPEKTEEIAVATEGGLHNLSGIAVADKANGGSVILVSTLANSGKTFMVKKIENGVVAEAPVVSYVSQGERLGDKIGFAGTWEDGEIVAVDYGSGHRVFTWKVTNGVAAEAPTVSEKLAATNEGNAFTEMVKYSDKEWAYSATSMGWAPNIYTREGANFINPVGYPFGRNMASVRFFQAGGKDFMAFASFMEGSYTNAEVAILPIDRSLTLAENIQGKSIANCSIIKLQGPGASSTNSMGCFDMRIREVKGVVYIAAIMYDNYFYMNTLDINNGAVSGPGDAVIVPGGDF